MIYNKKLIFGLHPHFRPNAPQTFGISQVMNHKGVLCYVNEMTTGKPLGNLRIGAVARELTIGLEGWNFPTHFIPHLRQVGKRT